MNNKITPTNTSSVLACKFTRIDLVHEISHASVKIETKHDKCIVFKVNKLS